MISDPAPTYRRQRRRRGHTDLAFVRIDGRRHYLGEYDSPDSRAAYERVLAEYRATGFAEPRKDHRLRVGELLDRFLAHARRYYRHPDGRPTSELANFRAACQRLRALYGRTAAEDLGPRRLKAIRQAMIEEGLARTTINATVNRIRHVFKWAVTEELIPESVHSALTKVDGLKRGRSDAKKPEKVRPVPAQHIEMIRSFVSRPVWALVRLQVLSAARPGELVNLRAVDIKTRP